MFNGIHIFIYLYITFPTSKSKVNTFIHHSSYLLISENFGLFCWIESQHGTEVKRNISYASFIYYVRPKPNLKKKISIIVLVLPGIH